MRVKNNRPIKNGADGVFSLSGVGTRYINKSPAAAASRFPCRRLEERAGVRARNRSANSTEGIFLRHSNNITASGNVLVGNCVGLLALADAPGPAGDMRIAGNRVIANNKGCGGGSEGPPLSGLGIALSGAHDVIVTGNVVRQQRHLHNSIATAGIAVIKGVGDAAEARPDQRQRRPRQPAPRHPLGRFGNRCLPQQRLPPLESRIHLLSGSV